ncbi:hypothetical protein OV079_21425 [Nannocystis pusilla]|uniref:Uncharacterized protein n=1 Tax=Nannocystis pusilla TaxID=889268 RepID=A0A9X3IYY8_9BACT|nr:hypothetical protein [Nannocystis pusilla]MCY1008069.1 hypothetical protein [Nannocystis pusilla]
MGVMDDADEPAGVARVEFDEAEERGLVRLAGAMGLVGLLQVLLGGIGVVLALLVLVMARHPLELVIVSVLGLVYVGLPVWQGMLLREAGEAIGKVAGSDEDDQEYLASAFRRLRVVFVVELVLALWPLVRKLL